MLANEKLFNKVEDDLRKEGKLQAFEKENGPITGRMMIDRVELPDEIEVAEVGCKKPLALEASFDFYDTAVGVAVDPESGKFASKIWGTPQVADAEEPDEAWVEFFIQTLADSIGEDGEVGYPIYSFVNDTSDMTVVPTLNK